MRERWRAWGSKIIIIQLSYIADRKSTQSTIGMSHPYLCPSAWISATVALQKAGFERIIFGWMCFFYPLAHGTQTTKTQTAQTIRFSSPLVRGSLDMPMQTKRRKKTWGKEEGNLFSNFWAFHFWLFCFHGRWEVARRETFTRRIYRKGVEDLNRR